mmetsp:Transcript_29590/g.76432  ORF Transcript_29590/g.76432 Transcript_29590/m.76432 type:complete len:189 (+) Transcript_29590:1939-2505(+)
MDHGHGTWTLLDDAPETSDNTLLLVPCRFIRRHRDSGTHACLVRATVKTRCSSEQTREQERVVRRCGERQRASGRSRPMTSNRSRALPVGKVSLIRQLHCPGERGSGRSAAARRRPSLGCMPWPRRAAARMQEFRSRDLVARRPARCRRLHLLDLPAARVRVVRRGCACLVAGSLRGPHGPHAPAECA